MSSSRAEHNPGISLFEHLRSHLGARFVVFECTKATLVHVSHTIEDLILREQLPALLLTGFQESSHWRAETERYRALADVAHQVCIFAGGVSDEDSHAREIRVTLRGDDPLRQEWFVCALTPQLSFVLCGQDQQSLAIDEATRQFQTFWTFEPEVVSEVLDLLEAVLSHYRPERLADLQRARAQLSPAPPDARLVSNVLREMVRFEDQLQRTLREREARYKIVSELTTDYLYTINVTPEQQLIYTWSADGLTGLAGYAAHEIPERGELMPLAHPDDAPQVQAHMAALLAGREDVCEFRIIARDGETRWVRDYARPIIDRHSQRVSQIIGAASNISAQKRDQAALRAERDRFVKIAETMPGVVLAFRMQPDGSFNFPYSSPRIYEIYGLPPEALAEDGAVILQFWDPDDVTRILASVAESRQQMTAWRDEFRVRNPLRGELWIEGHSIPQAEPDGSTIWYGVLTDITARKRAEQALQQSHAALEERVDARTAELRAALERAQALYAITNDAIASDNMVEALQRAIERASQSISADRILMLILDHEQRSIEHLLYAEHGTGYINTEVSYDELMSGLSGWAIRERRPAISLKGGPDPRESPAVQRRRAELEHGAIIVLPLIYLNEVFGTLTAIRRPEEPDFSAEDIDLLSATAGQIALAYARMRLTAHLQRANAALSHEVHERTALGLQLQQQADRANALAALSRALAEAGRDLQPLFATIAAQTVQLIGDACVLTLLTPDGQSMEVTAIDHADPEGAAILRTLYPSGPYPVDSGLAGQVAQSGQPLLAAQVAPEHVRAQIKSEYLPYLDHFNIASLLIVPLHAHGRVLGTLGVTRDQPDRPYSADDQAFLQDLADRAGLAIENARLFAAAELARAEAERASSAKDAFLATMSHELRTPLNAILGYSESLHEQIYGPLTPRQHSAIDAVEAAGRHLLTLISDILDLSKVEAGQLEIQIQPVLLRDVCNASLLFVREQALKKRLRLSFQIDSHEATLAVDPGRLKQMLVNLLSNAVKFTPDGGAVGLDVGVDAIAGTARLTVHDSGIGIAPEDLGRLFQPFQQLDSRLNRQHEGTGLGLALVRRLAELHGGSVALESQVGQGSRFTITLPYHMPAPTEAPPPPAVAAPSQATTAQDAPRARILLAEDNESSIVAISDYLHTHGYALTIARNGHEALAQAEEARPDLILMDIQMPGMDGLTAIRRLRAQPAHTSTPIIALTALAMPGDKERCLEAGATAYMSKPVRLRTLSEMIGQMLGA